ncbi:hypothetical protein KI387_038859, partial [Taxus chinensis]
MAGRKRVALFHGQRMELNKSRDELIEHKSIQLDCKEITTLAVIHFAVDFNKQELLERVVERAKAASSGLLQILYARKIKLDGERERAMDEGEERESMIQILKWLPQGSLAIPFTDTKRLLLVQHLFFRSSANEELACFMADVRVDDKGRPTLQEGEAIHGSNISAHTKGEVSLEEYNKNTPWSEGSVSYEENETSSDGLEFIDCIELMIDWEKQQQQQQHEESMWRRFAQVLKKNKMQYFLHPKRGKVDLDELEGKAIGLLISDESIFEFGWFPYFQQIFHSFELVDQFAIGTYKRAVQDMPFASHPKIT